MWHSHQLCGELRNRDPKFLHNANSELPRTVQFYRTSIFARLITTTSIHGVAKGFVA
jgi:hypothetical protein